MSTVLDVDQEPAPQAPVAEERLVTTNTDALIVGRQLRFPIYDDRHVLLLSECTTITQKFKQLLTERHIANVQLNAADAAALGCPAPPQGGADSVGLDEGVVRKLDSLIDSGLLFVVNSGTAVQNEVTARGCTAYDGEKHAAQVERGRETSTKVDELMRSAARGENVDSVAVNHMVAQYLSEMTDDVDCTLSSVFEASQEREIADHCLRMALLGMAIGIEMGLDANNVRTLGQAALVNEWGMVRIPENIRNAKRRLTESEFFEIKKHPIFTLRLLEKLCGVRDVVRVICYQIHERPNGSGYPQGRSGERLHPMARILHATDMYNALISPRPFRPPLTALRGHEMPAAFRPGRRR